MEFIIISGMSGAGKSSAAAFLEDLGFYCVDNMPVALITSFAGLCMAGAGTGKYSRVALVTDIRGGQTFDELFQALDGLREMHLDYQLLFIEAADEDIIRRYKETRHTHPLTRQGYALPEAVKMERMALEIEQELQNSLEREISTGTIGEKVMEKLKKADEVAYVRFASVYRQFKDINTFMSELNKLLSEK